MAIETTYSSLRQKLAEVMDRVVDDQEVVIIRRRGSEDVAMLPASELASLQETAYLLRSPKNASRLRTALRRARKGSTRPGTTAQLRKDIGLGPAPKP